MPTFSLDNIDPSMSSKRRQCSDHMDPTTCDDLESAYCELVNATTLETCFEKSILELWGYDKQDYDSITREQILETINQPNLTR